MTKELFKAEEEALLRAEERMAEIGIESSRLYGDFADLASSFERLLMIGKRLSRISDRTTDSLFQDNKKLRLSQAELSELNKILEERDQQRQKILIQERAKLSTLVDLGVSLSAERNGARLMELILLGAKELTHADGGTLYIRTDDDTLRFEIMRTDSLGIAMGGTTGQDVPLPPVPLFVPETGAENHTNVVSHAVLTETTVNVADAYANAQFDFSGTRAFDSQTGYRSTSLLTVPLKPRGGDVIGALQLLNARDPDTGEVIQFLPGEIRFVEALAAQASVALDNRNLVEAQKALLDSFIQLIAGAIDAKSPYTGGHCLRVPDLATRLVRAASDSDEPPFADFRLETEDEWREFHIASWLHDCGKVTTPEFVVDKATKLETIWNRIHEIRTRFEILRRDAEIRYLRGRLDGGDDATLQAEFEAETARLTADFAFIAECNLGGEFMAPEKVARLRDIGRRAWTRHFDDRLGLSREEMNRFPDTPPATTPTEERLLADKPEHIVRRPDGETPYGGDNPFGFATEMPEHLYNRGELHNLAISRGTLTPEERYKINEHIVHTITMLEGLPWPKQLRRIPEYAGAHHETMIGTGYPRRLTAEQMSIPARVMAIADIFEALTAGDRPYKSHKTLSEAIRILGLFRDDQHIDANLFDLFLRSGIYRDYAEEFLLPEQLDEVDISPYLRANDGA